MKQFHVPQFITVEDKILGPFTFKQALMIGAGLGPVILARYILPSFLFWPFALVAGGIVAALAFLKINEVPFSKLVKNALLYFTRPRLYVWKKGGAKDRRQKSAPRPEPTIEKTPSLSESKLSDLAWTLNIKEKQAKKEEEEI